MPVTFLIPGPLRSLAGGKSHINVFVGTENVRYTGGLQTPIPDSAEISIIPAISGG
jgi:molybdopterin converting factor small subunit